MRIYSSCYKMLSEISRDLLEMGKKVGTISMQNLDVRGDENYSTIEIIAYSYMLKSMQDRNVLNLYYTGEQENKWLDAEFKERVNGRGSNPGEAYKIRSEVWDQFLVDGNFDYSYSERYTHDKMEGWAQGEERTTALEKVINTLKRDISSRQAILSVWDRRDINFTGGKRRVPCSLSYQFLFRDDQLSVIYTQRSCDLFTHFGNDVQLAWELKEYVAEALGVKGGNLIHNIASLHVYQKDFDRLNTGISHLKAFNN